MNSLSVVALCELAVDPPRGNTSPRGQKPSVYSTSHIQDDPILALTLSSMA